MAGNYDSVDFDFTWDGDLVLDTQGDLKDTSSDLLMSIKNEIFTVVKSSLGDWREDINVGADLDDFIGEPNSRDTAEGIETRLRSALSEILAVQDLGIRIIPVNIYKILIVLTLEVLPTPQNGLKAGTTIKITFLYDYLEKGVYVDIEDYAHFAGRGI